MYIVLMVLGLLLIGVSLAALLVKVNSERGTKLYEDIIEEVNPYLEKNDEDSLKSILSAIKLSIKGKKEVKTSSNTSTIQKYQRQAKTLLTNIGELVADTSDLDDFKTEAQIKKYVSSNIKKLLTKSGIKEWEPNEGDNFDTTLMIKSGDGNTVDNVIEKGYSCDGEVIIKARVGVR